MSSAEQAHRSSDHFAIPDVQKAWRNVRQGKPSKALVFDEQAPVKTQLAKGEVLIKVQAAALNPTGYKMMDLVPNLFAARPRVPEHDFAGVVVNANGTDLKNGQEVFGVHLKDISKPGQGALAQYIAVSAESVVTRPTNITPTQAAGLGVVGMTAHQALFDVGKLEPGMNVFINGGSTAVGASAIQFAKAIGCTVTATASGRNEEFIKSLGADVFIDYTKEAPYKVLERDPPNTKFHLLLEAVGNIDLPLYARSEAYLAPGGIFVSVFPQPEGMSDIPSWIRYMFAVKLRPTWLGGTNRTWKVVFVKTVHKDLEAIADMVSEGKFRPLVDSVFSFEDTLKAYDRIMSKRATGKVVIKVEEGVD